MPKRRSRNESLWGRKRQFLGRIANRSKVKRVKLLQIGNLVAKPGWYNAGYIFPSGYTAIIDYKDLESPDDKAEYMCSIKENHGKPLFTVRHMPSDEGFSGKSPTACWK
mmetsp:Transcript_21729/g.3597  ORF Transcript_21729/g.3597 Transcript_21729/m.3597 type:complete len:109 (+) Transcript_21729:212-538(+)|eukprot:CAMPEP_0168316196 /NCGR_PEP_ID=MMETSP0210-20121227/14812_1 /TAXON_ID=40633 /ORGANISM="Condylostoma magnum, Strain COL2" /LENGTH=108 /DNA_ID=CAMNT_0008295737 /DNA_START=207 /DNA_END=533 /DNA_ORIENTATION=+